MKYSIDSMSPDELPLLFSSWLKSHREANPSQAEKQYYARQHDVIQDIVEEMPLLLVARSEGVVLGWLCARATDDGMLIDYAYTKSAYRRFGVARELLTEAIERLEDVSGGGLVFTHAPAPRHHWVYQRLMEAGFEYRPATLKAKQAEARP